MSDFNNDFEGTHHKPRKIDKKKKHRKGFSEDNHHDKRQSRITFKRYIQELEEELLDDEMDENL